MMSLYNPLDLIRQLLDELEDAVSFMETFDDMPESFGDEGLDRLDRKKELVQSMMELLFKGEDEMKYKWEEESLQKYGVEATLKLIEDQKAYERIKKDNPCEHCGKGNQGAIIEMSDGKPFIMRYGLWSNGRCNYCLEYTGRK